MSYSTCKSYKGTSAYDGAHLSVLLQNTDEGTTYTLTAAKCFLFQLLTLFSLLECHVKTSTAIIVSAAVGGFLIGAVVAGILIVQHWWRVDTVKRAMHAANRTNASYRQLVDAV